MGYVSSVHNFFFLSALDMDPSTVFKSCKKYQQQSNMLIFINKNIKQGTNIRNKVGNLSKRLECGIANSCVQRS
jgi:hypothetical protein